MAAGLALYYSAGLPFISAEVGVAITIMDAVYGMVMIGVMIGVAKPSTGGFL